jgi:ribosomal protein L37AE/L43A
MARIKRRPEVVGDPYRCPHCGVVVLRESTKAWVASFCNISEKRVRLQRVSGICKEWPGRLEARNGA